MKKGLTRNLNNTRQFFNKTIECFSEEDSGFAPTPELYTVAGHVEHAAHTIEWLLDGGFGKGWDLNFEEHMKHCKGEKSLEQARAHLEKAFQRALETIENSTNDTLLEPIPNDVILDGAPRAATVAAIVDHTAHHRGALAVYSRLMGKTPEMPYA